jgi:hypothetical protein
MRASGGRSATLTVYCRIVWRISLALVQFAPLSKSVMADDRKASTATKKLGSYRESNFQRRKNFNALIGKECFGGS